VGARAALALGAALIASHNLFDSVEPQRFGALAWADILYTLTRSFSP
jgi:hypothetical protein